MEWLKDIKVIIFDLDGTLYQDHNFFSRYISYFIEGTKWEPHLNDIIEEVNLILSNGHKCKIGYFYEKNNDLILKHEEETVVEAITWDGMKVNDKVIPKEPNYLHNSCIYVGDAWSVVRIIACRLDISEDKVHQAFLRTRDDMITEANGVNCPTSLITSIKELDPSVKKILVTNTPEKPAKDLVEFLGLNDVFDEVIPDGNKPYGLTSLISRLTSQTIIKEHEILAVGDHAWNDLMPVKKLGGRTMLVTPYNTFDKTTWDLKGNIDHLEQLLQSMKKESSISIDTKFY